MTASPSPYERWVRELARWQRDADAWLAGLEARRARASTARTTGDEE